jgi:HNH endonuclease
VTVDLATLLGQPGSLGGELGWTGSVGAEATRRLACDAELTRVLVTRHPHGHPDPGGGTSNHSGSDATSHPHGNGDDSGWDAATSHPRGNGEGEGEGWDGSGDGQTGGAGAGGLAARLQAARRLLPPALGGPPTQPLEVGRATRTVARAQRTALVVRDGGCGFPGCDRPQSWCEAHHLRHWLHGGPTDLGNLTLLCRTHHRAVHEGGWRLGRDPDGRLTATPPHRRRPTAA